MTGVQDGDTWGRDPSALTDGQALAPLPARLAVLAALTTRGERRVLDGDADPALVAAVEGGWPPEEELPEVAASGWWDDEHAAEAVAFDVVGIDPAARRAWVARGSGAAGARACVDSDVHHEEARVRRAAGRTPAEARAHRHADGPALPPEMAGPGWTAPGDGARRQRSYSVPDPPGTRGVIAARHESLRRPGRPTP